MLVGVSRFAYAGGAPNLEAGEHIAQTFCAKCHAVETVGKSPLEPAPPFRTFHKKWPLENLEEALAEGIVVGHEAMPAFELSTEQISDLIGYMRTLEP
ncbi:MAG: c-type cytochrome [Alphaproteobacteria bacterium]|nr:c-type cytochrome [Alphaproteobacteria bacterium]